MSPKKWYQTFDWSKITEPLFRWGAVVMVGVLTSGAVVLNAGDSTDTKTAVSQYTKTERDSLWRCMSGIAESLREHNARQREQQIRDSLNLEFSKREIAYIRTDISTLNLKMDRVIQSRSFAAR